jgi:hypothetical protein
MEIGLFSREDYLSAMAGAGLKVMEEYKGTDVRGARISASGRHDRFARRGPRLSRS